MKNLLLMAAITMLAVGCARGPAGHDGQSITGPAGNDGKDAIIEIIDVCGPSGGRDEVILRFADRSLVVYFEQGNNRFLTELTPGTYQTTDSQRCVFVVDENLNVTF